MTRTYQLTFIVLMSIIVAFISFLPTILIDRFDIDDGYYVLILAISPLLILIYYRRRDNQNASFRKLLMTGSSIIILGLVLNYAVESIHIAVIGEDGVQQMIDRKVEKRIEAYDGTRLNIFNIEKSVIEDTKIDTMEEVVVYIFGVMFFILLVFIYSLILRTDKTQKEDTMT